MGVATIRAAAPADAAAIARVRVEAWRATYRGLIPDPYLDSLSIDDSTRFWQRILDAGSPHAWVRVADEGGEIVAFASGNRREPPVHGFGAELSAVYVRADRQRAGLGRRLVGAVTAAAREAGADGLIVFVIAGNKPARAFYDNLGAELLLEQPFEWDGIPLVEAAYGWHDLAVLSARAARGAAPH